MDEIATSHGAPLTNRPCAQANTGNGEQTQPQYWLWVTRPEYYLDSNGNDSPILLATTESNPENFWTCHKDTKFGDLVLLWRTRPKSDIGYLIQAMSDAYRISEYELRTGQRVVYACEFRVIHKFAQPVELSDIRANEVLQTWGALRSRFFGRAFRISDEQWEELISLARAKNSGFQYRGDDVASRALTKDMRYEKHLEDALEANLSILRPYGYDLELYADRHTERTGRQLVCKECRGRIDLLCYDRRKKQYIVIELKNETAGRDALGQIQSYIGWVKAHIAGRRQVKGLVISRGMNVDFEYGLRAATGIEHTDVDGLGLT